jgi:hypothetical protein
MRHAQGQRALIMAERSDLLRGGHRSVEDSEAWHTQFAALLNKELDLMERIQMGGSLVQPVSGPNLANGTAAG